jgi:hypothetical protein
MFIFIPVLFICINSNCEFMQSTQTYRSEKQCRDNVELQKQHMKELVKKAGKGNKGNIKTLEGTCIEVKMEYSV